MVVPALDPHRFLSLSLLSLLSLQISNGSFFLFLWFFSVKRSSGGFFFFGFLTATVVVVFSGAWLWLLQWRGFGGCCSGGWSVSLSSPVVCSSGVFSFDFFECLGTIIVCE